MEYHTDGIPIVEVKRKGKQVYFHCEYCQSNHYHGAGGLEIGKLSHRVAHCISEVSPYKQKGYYLKLTSEVTT